MFNYLLVTILCFYCSLYFVCVCTQPPGAPIPTVFLNDGNRLNAWVWPTVSNAALQAGVTYTIGANLTGYGASGYSGQAEVNITFTVNSGCSTSYCSSCVSTYGAPSNNQGWRWIITTSASGGVPSPSTELPATILTSGAVWTGPTSFGSSRLPKISVYFDHIDACNCIFVNYISFTTTDLNTTGNHNAYFWNGGSDQKREEPDVEKRCKKREEEEHGGGGVSKWGEKRGGHCSPLSYWGTDCEIARPVSDTSYLACCWFCPTLLPFGSNLAPSWASNFNPTDPWAKRTNSKRTTNYYVYWINVNQPACEGIGTYENGQSGSLGSYGNGPSGSVTQSASLGVTYL